MALKGEWISPAPQSVAMEGEDVVVSNGGFAYDINGFQGIPSVVSEIGTVTDITHRDVDISPWGENGTNSSKDESGPQPLFPEWPDVEPTDGEMEGMLDRFDVDKHPNLIPNPAWRSR